MQRSEADPTVPHVVGNMPLRVRYEPDAAEKDPRDNRMPLDASVNMLHRSFVGRPPSGGLLKYFRHVRRVVSDCRASTRSGPAKKLCDEVETRLVDIDAASKRGANRFGLVGQFHMSHKLLNSSMPSSAPAPVSDAACACAEQNYSRLAAEARSPSSAAASLSRHGLLQSAGSLSTDPTAPASPPAPSQASNAADVDASAPFVDCFVKPFNLGKLPEDFDAMLDAVEVSWETGDAKANVPALKTLVQGSAARAALKAKQRFGRSSSTMLSKRGTIAKAAALRGGWHILKAELKHEKSVRFKFRYNDVYSFCAALVHKKKQ